MIGRDFPRTLEKNFSMNTDDEKCLLNDVKVLEVRISNPCSLFYKTSYKDETFKEIDVRRKCRKSQKELVLMKAYSEAPSIGPNKKKDLISLCSANLIPRAHHQFFFNLKCSSKTQIPAEEDSDE